MMRLDLESSLFLGVKPFMEFDLHQGVSDSSATTLIYGSILLEVINDWLPSIHLVMEFA